MGETPPGGRAHAAQVDGEGGEEEVKELEVEHVVVMSEVSEIVEALEDMDL